MRRSPQRRKVLRRTGLAVLSVVALVGNSPPAWGHGTLTGSGTTVHTCMRALPPRILRIVTPAAACSTFEQGLDLPGNGTLVGVGLGPPTVPPGPGGTLAATGGVITAPIVAECPAAITAPATSVTFRAVGITFTHTVDLALAVSLPNGATAWQVAFVAPTTAAKAVTVQAVCVAEFQQS